MVKTSGDSVEHGVFIVQGAQENGNQSGLPVMAMENIGQAEDFGGLENGAAVECEALGIVMVVAKRSAIESLTIVERRIIDEVELDAVLLAAVHNGAEAVTVIERNGETGDDGAGIFEKRLCLPVERQVHCDLVTESGNGTRQGSDDVGKSSGFGKRNTLGCGKQDVHVASAMQEIGCAGA